MLEGAAVAVMRAGGAAALVRCVLRGIRRREVVFTLVVHLVWRFKVSASRLGRSVAGTLPLWLGCGIGAGGLQPVG